MRYVITSDQVNVQVETPMHRSLASAVCHASLMAEKHFTLDPSFLIVKVPEDEIRAKVTIDDLVITHIPIVALTDQELNKVRHTIGKDLARSAPTTVDMMVEGFRGVDSWDEIELANWLNDNHNNPVRWLYDFLRS